MSEYGFVVSNVDTKSLFTALPPHIVNKMQSENDPDKYAGKYKCIRIYHYPDITISFTVVKGNGFKNLYSAYRLFRMEKAYSNKMKRKILEEEEPIKSEISISACLATPEDFDNLSNFNSIMNNTIHQGENTMKIRVIKKQIQNKMKTINAEIEKSAKLLLTDAQILVEHDNVTAEILEDISKHTKDISQLRHNAEKVRPYLQAQELIMDEEEYNNFINL